MGWSFRVIRSVRGVSFLEVGGWVVSIIGSGYRSYAVDIVRGCVGNGIIIVFSLLVSVEFIGFLG